MYDSAYKWGQQGDTTSTHYKTADTDIQHCILYITNIPHSVLTGDVNAHSTLWHSYTDDHRGQLIADVISNSDHITLNTNTPTRVPNTTLQQTSSPDITTVSNTLYNRTSWTTQHALSSDHLPKITTINIRHDYRLQQNRRTITNYKKADWTQFTEDTRVQTQHSTVTALHTLNNTVAKGFNQMAPPARTITVALDMSKAFDTINIHTLIRKLLQTNIPGTIIKLIANYIKGRKAYTTYRNHTSKQRQFKTGVPQGGVLSLTLFTIYTSDLPPPSAPVHVMVYADDITITSTHTSTSAAKKYIQPYPHKVVAWTKQNNLLLNPDKTTCTLFTADHAEYTSNLDLTINNKALPMATHPNVLGLTSDPKLTYSTHHINISVQAHKPLQIIKALTATGWGKQKETLMATYKAVMTKPTNFYQLQESRLDTIHRKHGVSFRSDHHTH